MRLIGMLDSPFVRRVAVSLHEMGLAFEHESVSVFRHFDAFAAINPVVKAPTLVTDEGVVLMDSTLILEHLEGLAEPERRLTPADPQARLVGLRLVGLALAACEKAVQLIYERDQRPADKRHDPWTDRVRGQLAAAFDALEVEAPTGPLRLADGRPTPAGVIVPVAWRFTDFVLPGLADASRWPQLAAISAAAEARESFRRSPLD